MSDLVLPDFLGIGAVKAGTTTREIASKWPSAKDTWGYEEEDQAAANLWGHGLGLAQYDPPVISRIWSLDHPIEIKPGMVFALETQHGKQFRWGVRIEEMLAAAEEMLEHGGGAPAHAYAGMALSRLGRVEAAEIARGRSTPKARAPSQWSSTKAAK